MRMMPRIRQLSNRGAELRRQRDALLEAGRGLATLLEDHVVDCGQPDCPRCERADEVLRAWMVAAYDARPPSATSGA